MRSIIRARKNSVLLLVLSVAAFGQSFPADLRGVWQAQGTAYLDLEKSGVIVDPEGGKIPYLPGAVPKRQQNFANRAKLDPELRCFQAGVPRATYLATPLQIFQNSEAVYVVYQDVHAYRVIYLERSTHNDGLPFAMGDSRGHWEGSTLVADVVSFSDSTWFDRAGNYHSDGLHVVERYDRKDPQTLQYEARIEDPKVFTKPWTIRLPLKLQHTELIEDECEIVNGVRRHVSAIKTGK